MAPAGTDAYGTLVEREQELTTLDGLVDAAAEGDGRFVLIEGPAGIGKTRLLAEARRLAQESGMLVTAARAGELEREFPYGVVRQLFEARIADPEVAETAFAGAAGAARGVFDSVAAEGADDTGGFATLHALYWLALNLGNEQPLLIEVDDIQWCDRPSLRFLSYLVRRLEGTAILVGATQRSAEPGTDPALLAELASSPMTVAISPGPLSADAVRAIIADRLEAEPDDGFAAACLDATGGNPLLLRELLTALRSERVGPTADQAGTVRELGKKAVSRSVLLRLSRLSPDAAAVARAAAIHGDGGTLTEIAELAGLNEEQVASATRELVRAEIFRRDASLGFVHPLILDAVLGEMSPGEREVQHGRAAGQLHDAGASTARIATHLLMTSPRGEPAVIEMLRQAGGEAVRKGASESAVAYLRRALAEGPADRDRPQLLFELGLAEALTEGPPAAEHLEAAYAGLRDPLTRVIAAHVLGRLLLFMGRAKDAADLARRAADEAEPEMPDTALALRAFEYSTILFDAVDPARWEELKPFRELPLDGGPGQMMMAGAAAVAWAYQGEPDSEKCAELALASLADGQLTATDNGFLNMSPLLALVVADRDEVMDEWEKALADARQRGSLFAISGINMWRGYTHLYRGELAEAEASLRTAYDEFQRWQYGGNANAYCAGFLALTRLARGDIDGAWRELALGEDPGDRSDGARFWWEARTALLSASGRNEEAIRATEKLETDFFVGTANPAVSRWRTHRAEVLDRLGRKDEALEVVKDEIARAEGWGAPGTIGPPLRMRGTLRGPEGIEDLQASVEILERSTAKRELAKSLASLGTALRLARKPTDAREPLGRALELATACSADGLVEHVRSELHATGARPRREALSGVESLTPSERRVASLATEGLTNREIAQSLYVTPKTVEVHLSNTYRKLDIRSRRELTAALVSGEAG